MDSYRSGDLRQVFRSRRLSSSPTRTLSESGEVLSAARRGRPLREGRRYRPLPAGRGRPDCDRAVGNVQPGRSRLRDVPRRSTLLRPGATAASTAFELLAAGSGGALAAPVVDVVELVESAVALPDVGYHRRARFDVIRHEAVQRRRRCIGERRDPAPVHPLRHPNLDCNAGQGLLARRPAAAQARLLTADVSIDPLPPSRPAAPARGVSGPARSRCGMVHAVW